MDKQMPVAPSDRAPGPKRWIVEPPEAELDRAYGDGRRAFAAGHLVSSCPYSDGSPQHDAWVSGWFDLSHAIGCLPDD
jgi:ribosome modulation factor